MRIVHMVPGSGGSFYCENCLRDVETVKELRRQGHDVVMVPMYLPLFDDAPGISGDTPIFFGGINTWLQQNTRLFRKTPRWIDRVLDARWLLAILARRAAAIRSTDLGEMTISMLKGLDGNQAKEVRRLVDWLKNEERPDVVHVSNALLLGLVGVLKEELGVPVVCSLQDEGDWIDSMEPPWNGRCWRTIAEKVPGVDAFASVSRFYAGSVAPKLGIEEAVINVVPVGVDSTGFRRSVLPSDPPVLGFMARESEAMGLDILVNAFVLLRKEPGLQRSRLVITGGKTGDDERFIEHVRRRVTDAGVVSDVKFVPRFDRSSRQDMLASLTVMCVPSREERAFGLCLLESMAAGVPVVVPDSGGFREIVEQTGGGIVYSPNTAESVADKISGLLSDRDRLRSLADDGYRKVRESFSVEESAGKLIDLYEGLR